MAKNISCLTDKESERFLLKVDIRKNSCWEWKASKTRLGYGSFSYRGIQVSAHRFSYVLSNGEIPDGMDVLHSCDNPGCVNPSHLFLGTHRKNMEDKARKLRAAKKLTPIDVDNIRKSSLSYRQTGKLFGITHWMVSLIKSGKSWSHLP